MTKKRLTLKWLRDSRSEAAKKARRRVCRIAKDMQKVDGLPIPVVFYIADAEKLALKELSRP